MSDAPKVSVVITTYNQAAYLGETLGSVLAQTYRPHEIIVVDDGSTDETATVVRRFDPQVRYLYQTNRGVAGSRNTGVAAATGELVALLDGDDLWEPEKLARQVQAFQAHPESGLIACDASQVDDERVLWSRMIASLAPDIIEEGGHGVVLRPCYQRLLDGNFIPTTSQVMIPREVLARVGPSDDKLPVCSDYDLYLRIAARYPFAFVADVLTRWRYLPTSASGPAALRSAKWADDVIAALKKQLRDAPADRRPLIRSAIARKVTETARAAYYYGCTTDRAWAVRYLWRLIAANPGTPTVGVFLAGLLAPESARSFAGPWITRMVSRTTVAETGGPSA